MLLLGVEMAVLFLIFSFSSPNFDEDFLDTLELPLFAVFMPVSYLGCFEMLQVNVQSWQFWRLACLLPSCLFGASGGGRSSSWWASTLSAKLPTLSMMSMNLLELSLYSWMTSQLLECIQNKWRLTRVGSLSLRYRMSSPSISVMIISISFRNIFECSLFLRDRSFFCSRPRVSSQFCTYSIKA